MSETQTPEAAAPVKTRAKRNNGTMTFVYTVGEEVSTGKHKTDQFSVSAAFKEFCEKENIEPNSASLIATLKNFCEIQPEKIKDPTAAQMKQMLLDNNLL